MSLQRVGKENEMGFLSIDFDALGREIKTQQRETEASRSCNKKTPIKMAKQTSGNLHKQQHHSKIGFLENEVPQPERKVEKPIKAESAHKLDNKFENNLQSMTSKSVMSARAGEITDTGGPRRQVQSEASNSIFDSEAIQRMTEANHKDSKDKITESKEARANKATREQEDRMDKLTEALQQVDLRKASEVGHIPTNEAETSYKVTTRNISIFDTEEFQRLSEKTAGEKIAERRQAERAEVDDSWRGGKGALSNKDVVNRLFDSLMDQGE